MSAGFGRIFEISEDNAAFSSSLCVQGIKCLSLQARRRFRAKLSFLLETA